MRTHDKCVFQPIVVFDGEDRFITAIFIPSNPLPAPPFRRKLPQTPREDRP